MSKAPITWFGGKSRQLHWLLPLFPPHQVFVDVFGGSGAVLLGKPPSPVDVYNDIDGRLVNLFRVLRDEEQAQRLIKSLELTPFSRSEFMACADPDPIRMVSALQPVVFWLVLNVCQKLSNVCVRFRWNTWTGVRYWPDTMGLALFSILILPMFLIPEFGEGICMNFPRAG
jgi:site-specific DNA-adenine methylase